MALKLSKASAQKAYMKLGFYGESGTGKSLTSLLLAEFLAKRDPKKRRIAYVDTEQGTDFYAQHIPERKVHPEPFDFDKAASREVLAIRDFLGDPKTSEDYCVVVLDSVTHLWESAKEAYTGPKTSIGTLPVQAFAKIKPPYKAMLANGLNGQYHFIICGRQKINFEEDPETGKLSAQGTSMKAEGETPYEPDFLVHLYQEREVKDSHGLTPFVILAYVEKDRSGVLMGRTLAFPKGEDFAGILPYLGGEHGRLQTVEESAEKDAEAQQRDEDEKAARRLATFDSIRRAMQSAKDHVELKAAWDLTTGKKMVLGNELYEELKQVKENQKAEINKLVAV